MKLPSDMFLLPLKHGKHFVIAKLKDEQEAVIRLNRMATESEPKAEIQNFRAI